MNKTIQIPHLNIDVAPHTVILILIKYDVMNLHRQLFTLLA